MHGCSQTYTQFAAKDGLNISRHVSTELGRVKGYATARPDSRSSLSREVPLRTNNFKDLVLTSEHAPPPLPPFSTREMSLDRKRHDAPSSSSFPQASPIVGKPTPSLRFGPEPRAGSHPRGLHVAGAFLRHPPAVATLRHLCVPAQRTPAFARGQSVSVVVLLVCA